MNSGVPFCSDCFEAPLGHRPVILNIALAWYMTQLDTFHLLLHLDPLTPFSSRLLGSQLHWVIRLFHWLTNYRETWWLKITTIISFVQNSVGQKRGQGLAE